MLLGLCIVVIVDWNLSVYESHSEIGKQTEHSERGEECCRLFTGPIVSAVWDGIRSAVAWIDRNHDFVIAASGLAVAVFTLTLWLSTLGLFKMARRQDVAMRRSLRIARRTAAAATSAAKTAEDALLIPQRAYLCVVRQTTEPILNSDGVAVEWKFAIEVQNTGNTPAVRADGGIVLQEVLRGAGDELGQTQVLDTAPGTLVVGPRSSFSCGGHNRKGVLTMEQAKRIVAGEIDVFLSGLVSYNDIFTNTPRRNTEYCVRLSVADSTFKRPNPFGYHAYHKYNNIS